MDHSWQNNKSPTAFYPVWKNWRPLADININSASSLVFFTWYNTASYQWCGKDTATITSFMVFPIRKNQGYGFQLAENLDMLCQTSLSLQCKNSAALEEFAVAMDGDFLSIDTGQRKTTKHNQNWNRNLENHYHHLWDWKSKMVRGRFICTSS